MPAPVPPEDPVDAALRRDRTWPREAYEFVQESLAEAHRAARRRRHVTAAELLAAFRRLARTRFGPLARTVLTEWNVRSTADVGGIVYRMIDAGGMGRSEDDDEADFRDVFDFRAAFPDTVPPERLLPPGPSTVLGEEEAADSPPDPTR